MAYNQDRVAGSRHHTPAIPYRDAVISVPVVAYTDYFKWQLDLFWFGLRRVYGREAGNRAHAIVISRNDFAAQKAARLDWDIDIPHTICDAFFDLSAPPWPLMDVKLGIATPINIQIGLVQVLDKFDDDQLIEVNDSDMVYFRRCPVTSVKPNELMVAGFYENWHLFSQSTYRHLVSPYFENEGRYYNGGFVPIIGRVSTFRRILPEWIAVHAHMLQQPYGDQLHWWAGMYALQAACEKARIQMVSGDYVYIPSANEFSSAQYIGHYCCDSVFSKRTYPQVNRSNFKNNMYYQVVGDWLKDQTAEPKHVCRGIVPHRVSGLTTMFFSQKG